MRRPHRVSPKIMREDALPDQSDDAAEQNSRGDQKGVAAGASRVCVRH